MQATVSLPVWAFALLAFLSGWAVLDRLLRPAMRAVLRRRANRYATEIVPAFNAWIYFRAGYAVARAVARSLYRVRIGSADDEGLAAIPDGATVVFVMNHRSNMDYILLSYLAAERTALSYAVGEWARIWPIQSLVRATGAYFVRRDANDPLYRRVLERYVAMATAHGVPQAVYPEGGLSKDGALRPPKLGLLDYMLRGFDPDGARDWHRFGYACVRFGSPLSTKAWLASRSLDLGAVSREDRFAAVQSLAGDLMTRIARIIPVLPVSLVSSVFAAAPGRALSEIELKAEVLARWRTLEAAGAEVYVPRGDQDYAVTFGLRMLLSRHLVTVRNGLFEAVPAELPLLRYYANAIARP
jgi:glycerol-3-phosphate O-acyltransferase